MTQARELPILPSAAPTAAMTVQFHLSLNVSDLDRSVQFFRVLLDRPPSKLKPDYAKFELDNPPLVLSLAPAAVQLGGALNHLGFRMSDAAALVDVQRRLELAGIATRREDGVECCYARQTKFWVTDPDNNLWEIYTLEADLEHCGAGGLPEAIVPGTVPSEAIWQHRLGEPLHRRLPLLDSSVDLARLEGTLNDSLDDAAIAALYAELQRALRPGGRIEMHLLTADVPIGDSPLRLPGPAAAVRHVPVGTDVLQRLRDAGFVDADYTFRSEAPWFFQGSAGLRETRLAARKAGAV